MFCQPLSMSGRENSGQNSDEPLVLEGKLSSGHAFMKNVVPLL
jgi:hypothetical protein